MKKKIALFCLFAQISILVTFSNFSSPVNNGWYAASVMAEGSAGAVLGAAGLAHSVMWGAIGLAVPGAGMFIFGYTTVTAV